MEKGEVGERIRSLIQEIRGLRDKLPDKLTKCSKKRLQRLRVRLSEIQDELMELKADRGFERDTKIFLGKAIDTSLRNAYVLVGNLVHLAIPRSKGPGFIGFVSETFYDLRKELSALVADLDDALASLEEGR